MLSAGQLSLHISQMRMFTQYLVLMCICAPLWKILSVPLSTGYTLQVVGPCPLENLNPVFTHTQKFWYTDSTKCVGL